MDRAFGAHDQRVFACIQAARTVIAVVAADRRDDIREAEARSGKPCAIRHHSKALGFAAQHVDIGNAGQRAQGRAQRPVQQGAALAQREATAFDGEHEHVRQRCRNRRQPAADAFGQAARNAGIAFSHLLTRPVDVAAFGEVQRDVGDGVLGRGAQHHAPRHAEQLHLQRRDHARLHLLGRHARGLDNQLDLRGGNIRIGVDRQLQEGRQARTRQSQHAKQYQRTLAQGKFNQTGQHAWSPLIAMESWI